MKTDSDKVSARKVNRKMRDKGTFITRCLSAGICIFVLIILVILADSPEKSDGYSYYDPVIDQDSRIIRIKESPNGVYEDTCQGSNETDGELKNTYYKERTDGELTKTFYKERTDDGTAVRIVSICDGEEKVLTDCEYSTFDFPYYFERGYEDIFYTFYLDDFVWEKTIYIESTGETYTLYYAQEIQYDSEGEEERTGFEGHLWVTDEDTRIVKRLFWQSEEPCTKITWEESMLLLQYADGSDRTCTLSEILKDPAEAVYEKCMQIDYSVKEYAIDAEEYDDMTDRIFKEAYYSALSGKDMVRTREGEEVYLKEYWYYQGGSDKEMSDEVFLENLIENAKFYYMDFDGDGLPELVTDIIGDGLHILKYLPNEEIVELFFGYERMPYYNLLGSGQLYYRNPTVANIGIWRYDIVDTDGQDYSVVYFEENADYKPHKDDESEWWDMAYFVYLDEELGLVQVDEERYQEITAKFFDAVEHAVTDMTFEEVFGEI